MKPKSIELIAFDKHQNLQYAGKCKIRINQLSSMLSVEPVNEDFKMVSALFKWDFIMKKNILFVFAEHELNDFALIFDNENRCQNVYDLISNDNVKKLDKKDALFQRFWIPFCKKLSKNEDEMNVELKQIFKEFLDSSNDEEKEEFINLLKEKNIFDLIYSPINVREEMTDSNNERNINLRKRKRSQIQNVNKYRDDNSSMASGMQNSAKTYSKISNQSMYKVVNAKKGTHLRRRLLIFTTVQKNYCYEFAWSNQKNIYHCIGCRKERKEITAIFGRNKFGHECMKLEGKKHYCSPLPYISENYIEVKIYKKSEYEILEHCNRASGRLIIVFDENDRSQCWEFRFQQNSNYIYCCSCKTTAKLWNRFADNEYLELMNSNHQCKSRQYNLTNYYEFKDFVLPPNFEVRHFIKNGEERKKLIIFDKTDRNLCYIYTFYKSKCTYYCQPCCTKKVTKVSARILKNSDDEDYVILSKTKHVCDLKPYAKLFKQELILRSPDFEILDKRSVKKLRIFDSNDRSLCYMFTQNSKAQENYRCSGCENFKIRTKRRSEIVRAQIFKENGENFVRLNNSKHICKPLKFEEVKEIPKCYQYFFFKDKNLPNVLFVGFYHPDDKNLCFKLSVTASKSLFRCNRCSKKPKKTVTAKFEEDNTGKEYFSHNVKDHVCKPIKVSSISSPKFVILKREDLDCEIKVKKEHGTEINKSVIIKLPNFELRSSRNGIPDGALFIFNSNDQSTGYKYYFSNYNKKYYCCQDRRHRCGATAKLDIDENGEKCILQSSYKHKCEPVQHEKPGQIINASDFIIVPLENKKTMIFVFTTPARDECYEFGFTTPKDTYCCLGCKKENKHVTVKLSKDENGQNILSMSNKSHDCVPRKYNKEKYDIKIIPSEMFELFPNRNGESEKKLVIFTSDKKDLIYEYCWKFNTSYACLKCMPKKKYVIAKIIQDKNGQKFVEYRPKEHACEPRKYDPKKYSQQQKIISNDLFKFFDGKMGEKEKNLVIFTSDSKKFAYRYHMTQPGIYRCIACTQKKNVIATVIQEDNGITSLKLGPNEHICKPEEYNPQKFKF